MQTIEYQTGTGFQLEIGSIRRRTIDDFELANPQPKPPVKSAADMGVAVFGDVDEWIEDWSDQGYTDTLDEYYLSVFNGHIGLVAPAVRVVRGLNVAEELRALTAVEILPKPGTAGYRQEFLRNVVLTSTVDALLVTQTVFYLSTVTPRGIIEALDRFGLRLDRQPVNLFDGKRSRWRANSCFTHRQAARGGGYTWEAFCDLSGPQQSECLVFHLLDNRIRSGG